MGRTKKRGRSNAVINQQTRESTDQPITQPTNRPKRARVDEPPILPPINDDDLPLGHLAYQPDDQPVNQPSDQPIDPTLDRPINQYSGESFDETLHSPVDVSIDQSVVQSVDQPVEQSLYIPSSVQSIHESIDPSSDQSIDRLLEQVNQQMFILHRVSQYLDLPARLVFPVLSRSINAVFNPATWCDGSIDLSITLSLSASTSQSSNQPLGQLTDQRIIYVDGVQRSRNWLFGYLPYLKYASNILLRVEHDSRSTNQMINKSNSQPVSQANLQSLVDEISQSVTYSLNENTSLTSLTIRECSNDQSINQSVSQLISAALKQRSNTLLRTVDIAYVITPIDHSTDHSVIDISDDDVQLVDHAAAEQLANQSINQPIDNFPALTSFFIPSSRCILQVSRLLNALPPNLVTLGINMVDQQANQPVGRSIVDELIDQKLTDPSFLPNLKMIYKLHNQSINDDWVDIIAATPHPRPAVKYINAKHLAHRSLVRSINQPISFNNFDHLGTLKIGLWIKQLSDLVSMSDDVMCHVRDVHIEVTPAIVLPEDYVAVINPYDLYHISPLFIWLAKRPIENLCIRIVEDGDFGGIDQDAIRAFSSLIKLRSFSITGVCFDLFDHVWHDESAFNESFDNISLDPTHPDYDPTLPEYDFDNPKIITLSRGCWPNLESVCIEGTASHTFDHTIDQILFASPHLKSINVSFVEQNGELELRLPVVAIASPNIETIDISFGEVTLLTVDPPDSDDDSADDGGVDDARDSIVPLTSASLQHLRRLVCPGARDVQTLYALYSVLDLLPSLAYVDIDHSTQTTLKIWLRSKMTRVNTVPMRVRQWCRNHLTYFASTGEHICYFKDEDAASEYGCTFRTMQDDPPLYGRAAFFDAVYDMLNPTALKQLHALKPVQQSEQVVIID